MNRILKYYGRRKQRRSPTEFGKEIHNCAYCGASVKNAKFVAASKLQEDGKFAAMCADCIQRYFVMTKLYDPFDSLFYKHEPWTVIEDKIASAMASVSAASGLKLRVANIASILAKRSAKMLKGEPETPARLALDRHFDPAVVAKLLKATAMVTGNAVVAGDPKMINDAMRREFVNDTLLVPHGIALVSGYAEIDAPFSVVYIPKMFERIPASVERIKV